MNHPEEITKTSPNCIIKWVLKERQQKYGARPKVCSKRCSNYFSQRILKLKKYFWSFCKKEKVLEKFQHAENNFENSKHAVEKSNEVQREFEKGGESKYEKITNLPLARARRL